MTDTTTNERKSREKAAEHWLVDQSGNTVDREEEAHGIGYKLIALPNQPFQYIYGQNADMDRMLAIFGAKTLATNESSQVRNSPKGAGSPQEQIEAVQARFSLLQTGTWMDRTREGPQVNKDALAEAVVAVAAKSGKTLDLAAVRDKLDTDAEYLKKARSVPDVTAEYARIVGRTVATIDDLTAGL